MKRQNLFILLDRFVFIAGILLLLYLLYWRFELGLTRYLDADELAHLHWGYDFFSGMRPYTDFFYIFPPYFLMMISFLWRIFGESVAVVTEARIVIFLFFGLLLISVYKFGKLIRNSRVGMMSVLILSFVPIPYDKMIEIRPDLPAVGLAMAGMYLLIKGVTVSETQISNSKFKIQNSKLQFKIQNFFKLFLFLSGLFYGVSIGIVPKTVFFVPSVLLVFGFWYLSNRKSGKFILKAFGAWFAGLLIPVTGVFIFIVATGEPFYAFSLMTKVASDASLELVTIYNHSFYMAPAHFFWPNQTFYGEGGMNFQYYINLIIWIVGAIFAMIRLVGFMAYDGFRKQIAVLLLTTTFFFNLIGFIYIFPLKHSQYLIPLVPFVCLFFADFLESIAVMISKKEEKMGWIFYMMVYGVILYSAIRVNSPKIVWTNNADLEHIKEMEALIPKNSYVFDLAGYALKFSDPFYYCCVPYEQYWRVLPRKPSLTDALQKTDTKYVVNTRLDTLSLEDRGYIEETYKNFQLGGFLLSRN